MTQRVIPEATVTLDGGTQAHADDGRITLDETWSPYASGTITIPLDGLDLTTLDIKADHRAKISLTDLALPDPTPRLFDLALRGRTIDYKTRTVELDLASDEALLFDTCRLATTADSSARAHEGSLRGICNWALAKLPGAPVLEDGAWDADMTAQWDATNLLLNPNATTTVDEWSPAAACTIAWNGVAGVGGVPGSVQVTPTAPDSAIYVTAQPSNLVASPGDMFTASAYVLRAGAGTAQSRITLRYYDAANRVIAADKLGALFTITNAWSRISVTGVAPANTARVTAFITTYGLSTLWYADQAMLTSGPLLMGYFDGATADTTNYTYSWEGPANGSASLRVATPERHPDLFDWRPGQALWDFLRPFLEAAGLRLFCDELRDWRLIDPTQYQASGSAFLGANSDTVDGNLTAATDSLSRDRDDGATGVVVTFRWRDATGREREAFDVAGTPGKVVTFDRETAPLKGAAATILARLNSRGASQDATTVGGYDVRPAAFAAVDLADTPAQNGAVARVTFDVGTGLVDVTTRDMEVTP